MHRLRSCKRSLKCAAPQANTTMLGAPVGAVQEDVGVQPRVGVGVGAPAIRHPAQWVVARCRAEGSSPSRGACDDKHGSRTSGWVCTIPFRAPSRALRTYTSLQVTQPVVAKSNHHPARRLGARRRAGSKASIGRAAGRGGMKHGPCAKATREGNTRATSPQAEGR